MNVIAANSQHVGDLFKLKGDLSIVHRVDYTVQAAAMKSCARPIGAR